MSAGTPVPLVAKAFDILVVLVENRDRVMSKDELIHAVWPDVVVEEGNLSQQIFLIRKALGESGQQSRYIVTIPGRGYRFTATATEIVPEVPRIESAATGALARPRAWFGSIVGAVLAVGVIGFFSMRKQATDVSRLDPAALHIQKVSESGRATQAAISADGRYVAYVENEGAEYSLHVQHVASGGNTRLLPALPRMLDNLRFSPDGEFLYYTRERDRLSVLVRMPAIGGDETPVLSDIDTPISFSPDGSRFVFVRGTDTGAQLVAPAADGSTQRVLEERTAPRTFVSLAPAWSPDGNWVAASVSDESKGQQSSIALVPINGGVARDFYTTADRIGALRWLPDGSGLLAVQSTTSARPVLPGARGLLGGSVWRISYPDSEAERLTTDLTDYDLCCLDVTADGRTIVGIFNALVSDLWIAPADRIDMPTQITRGSAIVGRHSWLDDDTIVYSDVRGRLKAVRKDTSGFNLAVPEGQQVAAVSACGDGRYVVFQATPGNNIWRVAPNVGGPIKLTDGAFDLNPACSPDGQWMLYTSRIRGAPSLWRMPINGGKPAPLVPDESFDSLPSPSGRLIYHNAFGGPTGQRWNVIPSGGGDRISSIDRPADMTAGTFPSWAADESGLDYIVTRNGVSNVWRQSFIVAPPVQVTHSRTGEIFSLAWSRDGKWLSLASGSTRRDVVIISPQ